MWISLRYATGHDPTITDENIKYSKKMRGDIGSIFHVAVRKVGNQGAGWIWHDVMDRKPVQ